jgi:hypothetical protein
VVVWAAPITCASAKGPAPGASYLGGEPGGGGLAVAQGVGDDGGGHLQDALADGSGSLPEFDLDVVVAVPVLSRR